MECEVELDGRRLRATALLETDELVLRGRERVRIRLADVREATASDGRLLVRHTRGTVTLELGNAAARWARRISHPPTVADKLGVKPGHRVSLVGPIDPALADAVEAAGADVARGRPRKTSDMVLLGVERTRDLDRLAALERAIVRDGAVWVVYPKGRKDPSEADVLQAGKRAGLVDVKVARASDTHTALKFVVPRSRR
jgi:hypothetical protein